MQWERERDGRETRLANEMRDSHASIWRAQQQCAPRIGGGGERCVVDY